MIDLYRSDNLVVRCIPGSKQDRWVITFDNFGIGHGFDRSGFGEAFFQSRDVSAIHVMGRSDDWYQYPDIADALAVLREATAGSARVMTYGSSMGAYAAIRFADAVGADAVLALSPQYSIDPAKPPFDDRWSQHSHSIAWLPEIDGRVRCQACPVIVFDPKSADGMHANRFSADIDTCAIPLPHTGHPITTFLFEAGLLEQLVLDVFCGDIDVEATRLEALAARKTSVAYLNELTRRQPLSRPRTAIGLARKARLIAPNDPNALTGLAERLSIAGQHEEALSLFDTALSIAGRLPTLLIPYGSSLMKAGDAEGASKIAAEVLQAMPDHAYLWAWYAHILWSSGSEGDARRAIAKAVALDPHQTTYLAQQTSYREHTDVGISSLATQARTKWLGGRHLWDRRRYLQIVDRRLRHGAKP